MKWTKFRIKTITEAEDIIISTLYDIGLEGAQIEDKVPLTALEKEQMFVDILPEGPEDDGIAYLSFFVEEKEDGSLEVNGMPADRDTIVKQIKEELDGLRLFMEIGEGSVTVSKTEDIDWINNWKQYFHQFAIDDVLVVPSWEKIETEGKMVLHIDPGTAFGTGMHDTTQLCIRALRKFITPRANLLDVGTGSGILAILSLMFGAKAAVGTDLDPCAIEAVRENKEANGIPEDDFKLIIGNIIIEKEIQDQVGYECYDIVTANILAEVLVLLRKELGIVLYINSHSPYFIRAIEVKMAENEMTLEGRFYLTVPDEDNLYHVEDVSKNTERIYELLYKPLEEL